MGKEQPRTAAKPGTEPGEMLDTVRERLGAVALRVGTPHPRRAVIAVGPAEAPEAVRIIFEEFGARFITITGVDCRGGVELLYHFSFDRDLMVLTLRTLVPRPHPETDSVARCVPAAAWAEREVSELLGVTFRNHPDSRRLVLADDWPEGVHPLRREFRGE